MRLSMGAIAISVIFSMFFWGCEDSGSKVVGPDSDTDSDSDSDSDTDSDSDSDSDTDSDSDSDTDGGAITCEDAALHRTYVGCDFWPTVTYNQVWYDFGQGAGFEFAVVVANDGDEQAVIGIDGGALGSSIQETVPPGELKAIPLPWVTALKGTTFTAANTQGDRVASSVLEKGGAYHLVSSTPVTVWQFSPLEYHLQPEPVGCIDSATPQLASDECASVTNDASLLMPSTAMTGAYRVFTYGGEFGGEWGDAPGALAITATEDGTLVKVELAADVVGGTGVTAATAGSVVDFAMDAGDVVQLLGTTGDWSVPANSDLTGSVVVGLDAGNPGTGAAPNYKPIQVIGVSPIADLTPATNLSYADHMEEIVLPSEALGYEYLVPPPTGSSLSTGGSALPVEHRVRIISSVDGTTFSYEGTQPPGAPTSLDGGQWADVTATGAFKISSQGPGNPFMVVSFIQGSEPGASILVTPEQFRQRYSFLAPVSYDENYADVLVPDGATVTLDGQPLGTTGQPIGATGWSTHRVTLTDGATGGDGKYNLEADMPVGLQVMGYGWATSYYYPGGLDLEIISEPPVIVIE